MHIAAASRHVCPLWARRHAQNHCQVVAAQRRGSSPRCPCKPHPQPPRREGLPTSAAGRYICNGLQGWSWLRLIPDVDSPGMCLLCNCPASEGSHPPPLHPPLPLLHPSERAYSTWRPSSFPTACAGTATAGTRASPVGGRTLLQLGPWGWGAGGLSPSPFFFSGARHWGAEGETLENSL